MHGVFDKLHIKKDVAYTLHLSQTEFIIILSNLEARSETIWGQNAGLLDLIDQLRNEK